MCVSVLLEMPCCVRLCCGGTCVFFGGGGAEGGRTRERESEGFVAASRRSLGPVLAPLRNLGLER